MKLKTIKYDPAQIRMGIKIEMEHTKSKRVAEKISKDHLREFPDYYTHLIKMEKRLAKRKK